MNRFFIYGVLLLSMVSCTEIHQKKSDIDVVRVTAVVVRGEAEGANRQSYSGTLTASSSSMLSFQTGGRLEACYVKEGDRVRKGQKLAQIDRTQSLNALKSAESTLAQAKDAYARLKVVHDSGALSDVKWVEMQTKLEQAESMAQMARRNLEDCTLYAPFDGVVSSRSMGKGSHLLPSQSFLEIINTDTMYVRLDVPENDISAIRVGQRVDVQVLPLGSGVIRGRVTQKSVDADGLSHTYMVKAALPNRKGELMAGMVCKAVIDTESDKQNLTVPFEAVQLMPEGRYVWYVSKGKAMRKMVQTGGFTHNGVVVKSGLESGDTIVVGGRQKVYENCYVEITELK